MCPVTSPGPGVHCQWESTASEAATFTKGGVSHGNTPTRGR